MSWEDKVKKVVPYVPGEQPGYADMVKLNTNENPYPPAPGAVKALEALQADKLRLYPKPDAKELVQAIADNAGVDFSNVFVGVGSDDVLATAFLTFFNSDKKVLFPDITYSFYPVWAEVYGIPYEMIPLNEDFRIEAADYNRENGGIVIANPNAPTAIYEPLSFIEGMVKSSPDSVVIVDEAYVDFGGESAVELTKKYDNLLVVQTFSKSRSMAGMRIGYAIGSEKLISYMMAVRNSINSYTMNYPSIVVGTESVKDKAYFTQCCKRIIATREAAVKRLSELGFTTLPSCANFVFATHESVPAEEIFKALREKHIFVRYFKKPRIENYLRITIGTDSEMERLYEALKDILNK